MSLALDASVLIAHLDPDDVHHERATAILLDAAGGPLLAHPLTLAECLVAAVRAGLSEDVQRALQTLGVVADEVDADSPMRLARLRVETALRMPDCCVLDVARQHQATVATFDARLASSATALGLPVAGSD